MKVCPNCQTTLFVRTGMRPVSIEITTYINTNPAAPQKTTYCTHCAEALIAGVSLTSLDSLRNDLTQKTRIRDFRRDAMMMQEGGRLSLRENEDTKEFVEWRSAEVRLKEGEAIVNKEIEAKTAIQNQLTQFKKEVAVQKKDIEKQIQEQLTWFVLLTTATPAAWGHQVINTVDTICHTPFEDKLNLALQCSQMGGNALVDAKWVAYQGKSGNHSMMLATVIKVTPTAISKLDDRSVKAATELKRLYEL